MKMTTIAMLMVCLCASAAPASDAPTSTSNKTNTKATPSRATDQKADAKKTTKLTGSYLARSYRQSGQITDGPNQVLVIDRESIERSGASDLRDLLRRNRGR